MIHLDRKDFLLPLTEKIDVMGLRIETSQSPPYEIAGDKLKLTDAWNIQIAYTSFSARGDIKLREIPKLAEFQVIWEHELKWDIKYPSQVAVFYKKKPHSIAMHVQENRKNDIILKLTLETAVEIDFEQPTKAPAPTPASAHEPAPEPASAPALEPGLAISPQNDYNRLLEKINGLELRLEAALLEKKQLTASNINGTVLDSYRLLPIQKAIIEFYQNEANEPTVKLATDWQGKYSCTQLVPGTYDVIIKHPRYATLVVKDYIILEAENKYQDFLLRK